MTSPVLVHRYKVRLSSLAAAISKREGITEDQVEARVADGALILEIIGDHVVDDRPADRPSPEGEAPPTEPSPDADLKGGKRAQRAAIIAGEGAFHKWGEFPGEPEATAWIKEQCRVTSRRQLDHSPEAAEIFDRIDRQYTAWLEGY